jgi:hypothetical protein
LGKFRMNRYGLYYASIYLKNTPIDRQIERYLQDPIRLYEGTNEKVSNISIKGRRLG